jgi:hypothetical protein
MWESNFGKYSMNETEVRATVQKIIEENSLEASIIDCDQEYEDTHWTVIVEVARKDYDRVSFIDSYRDNFHIRWKQKIPPLVGAEIGDFVLIFASHSASDSESDVGLVSSKFTEENGSVYYGCRYIQIGLNNQFVNQMYDFELTDETYGGYPEGFLKVLTTEEVKQHLKNQLEIALKKELESAQTKFDRSVKGLPDLVATLQGTTKIVCDKIELRTRDYPRLSLKL